MAAAYKSCLVRLYERLKQKQPVPFGAFVDFGGAKLLCRSPELFFSLSVDGQLRTRPMKGTIKRGANAAEDEALKACPSSYKMGHQSGLNIGGSGSVA